MAISALKPALFQSPLLVARDPSKPFIPDTDASAEGLKLLSQLTPGRVCAVAY